MFRSLCLCLLALAAAAQIAPPRAGYIVYTDGTLRAVHGLAGAFTVGPALQEQVVSASYSGKSLVVKTERQLLVDGKAYEAPSGPATVVFDRDGKVGEVFFPAEGRLWTWSNGEFTDTAGTQPQTGAYIRDGELVSDGLVVRLPSPALRVSQMGEGWLAVYADKEIYAVRGDQVFELPEADQ